MIPAEEFRKGLSERDRTAYEAEVIEVKQLRATPGYTPEFPSRLIDDSPETGVQAAMRLKLLPVRE
jgi:hypothetical protein